MKERTGEAFEFDEKLTVVGDKLKVGEKAPDFELDRFDPGTETMGTVKLSDTDGKVRLLNVINSIDTPVCHLETHRWQDTVPDGVVTYTVSMDLPFAMARWQKAENVGHAMLSSHRHKRFGKDYGVLLKEWRLLQRAVFVIDNNGVITYAEYVDDQMKEPNYEAALAATK